MVLSAWEFRALFNNASRNPNKVWFPFRVKRRFRVEASLLGFADEPEACFHLKLGRVVRECAGNPPSTHR
jgi:hypothetical protein